MIEAAAVKPGRGYNIVSIILGSVLVVAGVLKMHQWAVAGVAVPGARYWIQGVLPVAEVIFGGWLIAGFHANWSRLFAMACFAGLMNVALDKALSGKGSCGCFGKINFDPWLAAAFDFAAVVALVRFVPRAAGMAALSAVRVRRMGFGVASASVVVVWLGLVGSHLRERANTGTGVVDVRHSPRANEEMKRWIRDAEEGISRNYSGLFVSLLIDNVTDDATVKKAGTKKVDDGDGGSVEFSVSPRYQLLMRFILRGEDLRRELLNEDGSVRELVTRSGGKAVQHNPGGRQAWVRQDHDDALEPLDPRCFGFDPPVRKPDDWIREWTIVSVRELRESGAKHLLFRSVDRKGREVDIECAEGSSYLPVQTVYYYADGTIDRSAAMAYQHLPGKGLWVPTRMERKYYDPGVARSPDSAKWYLRSSVVVREVRADPSLAADAFDPILPKNTFVSGGTVRPVVLKQNEPTSSLKDRPKAEPSGNRGKWAVMAAFNISLLVAGLFLRRKRFADR
jgi:Methylamine utilisation protein MauE